MLYVSEDIGRAWQLDHAVRIAFPDRMQLDVTRICQLQIDPAASPAPRRRRRQPPPSGPAIFAGVAPAGLFRSADGGRTFELVRSLQDRLLESGDITKMSLHSVVSHRSHPDVVAVGVSPSGVFVSTDGTKSWSACNHGLPDCLEKLAGIGNDVRSLWGQTTAGLFRSRDTGLSWERIGNGDRGHIGFGDEDLPPKAWGAFTAEIADVGARDAAYGDTFSEGVASPFAFAYGTAAGRVFASMDNGMSWRLVASGLPPVLCVRVLD
jgi:hypothetical protein